MLDERRKRKLMSRARFSQEQLAHLAEYMRAEDTHQLPIQPIARTTSLERFPLSFAQQRLWFLDQLQRDSPAYNMAVAYRIKGQINISALERSINEIVRRHEVLRATFKTVDGQPVQVIAPALTLKFSVENLELFPVQQREEEMQRRATAETQKPFNLVEGPLLRTRLFHLSGQEHVLLSTFHHIVFDGWSMKLLSQELGSLYSAYVQGKPSLLAELPLQYTDFAYWQREWLQGEVLEAELGYWKQQLAGAPPVLELPTDWPRPAIQTFHGGLYSFTLPQYVSLRVKALSRQEGCTLFQMLLTAFQVLLHRYTAQSDIVVGSPIANRNRVELEGLMGFFTNTLVLRTDLSGNPRFRELLGRVREMTADAYSHQDLPFEMLVDELQLQRDLSYTPLVQVLFALQNLSDEDCKFADLEASTFSPGNGTTKFDLSLEMVDAADGLTGNIQYSIDLFDAATIARLAKHFQTLLEALVATPDSHISDLSLLTPSDLQQMLIEWNFTATDYHNNQPIHRLFEVQVERVPTATAIDFEGEQFTYRELNERANRLAHFLQEQGIGPERPVGICVERSLEMAVGLLGILKAGGICVPLDPEYPQ